MAHLHYQAAEIHLKALMDLRPPRLLRLSMTAFSTITAMTVCSPGIPTIRPTVRKYSEACLVLSAKCHELRAESGIGKAPSAGTAAKGNGMKARTTWRSRDAGVSEGIMKPTVSRSLTSRALSMTLVAPAALWFWLVSLVQMLL